MGLFSRKRQVQERLSKLPHSDLPAAPQDDTVTIVYTGGALSVTLQRAKSKSLQQEVSTRLVWAKNQRLGLTFVELPLGGVAVKDVPGMRSDVAAGQELVRVDNVSVTGMSLNAVYQRLQAAPSLCVLNFAPPPSPIVVSAVRASASRRGIHEGMVLKAVNGKSVVGATLSSVGDALKSASERSPATLSFASYDSAVRSSIRLSAVQTEDPKTSRASLRNTLCIGAIAALLSL